MEFSIVPQISPKCHSCERVVRLPFRGDGEMTSAYIVVTPAQGSRFTVRMTNYFNKSIFLVLTKLPATILYIYTPEANVAASNDT